MVRNLKRLKQLGKGQLTAKNGLLAGMLLVLIVGGLFFLGYIPCLSHSLATLAHAFSCLWLNHSRDHRE